LRGDELARDTFLSAGPDRLLAGAGTTEFQFAAEIWLVRVLVGVYGSAGDLFPVVPLARAMLDRDIDVRLATPRSIGGYVRALGLPGFSVGDGSETRIISDVNAFDTRFNGWSSYRSTAVKYVLPSLERHVLDYGRIVDRWRPDIIISSTWAVAARIVANRAAIDSKVATIYPAFARLRGKIARQFARQYTDAIANLSPEIASLDSEEFEYLAWCAGPSAACLYEPKLLDPQSDAPEHCVGYTYWDAAVPATPEHDEVRKWIDIAPSTTAVVCFGSFVGLARVGAAITEVVDQLLANGFRALVVNSNVAIARSRDIMQCGFVPLSRLLPGTALAVHHGGLGTTLAAVRAGVPAAAIPFAWDQPVNATAIERLGVGIRSSVPNIGADAVTLVGDDYRTRTQHLSHNLVSTDAAVEEALRLLLG
jgi:sterol 3beta-glucosyltransferase